MKTFWTWLWKVLDNNKSIIGTFLFMLLQLPEVAAWFGTMLPIIQWVIGILTGASYVDHFILKKSLSPEKK